MMHQVNIKNDNDCLNETFLLGKQESEVKEVEKVMYHDWRLIPKDMEQQFRDFQPLPDPPVRYVPYPPLLRAMLLAQRGRAGGGTVTEEPALPLERKVVLNKDYFRKQEQERQRKEGTAVWTRMHSSIWAAAAAVLDSNEVSFFISHRTVNARISGVC